MIFLSYSGLIILLTSFFSLVLVFLNNPKKHINITWALFSFFVALWGLGMFFCFSTQSKELALFWARFLNLAGIFIPITFISFVYAYLNKTNEKLIFLKLSYLIAFLYFYISILFFDLFIIDIAPYNDFIFYPQAGPLYYFFPIIFSIYVIIGIKELWKDYKFSTGLKKHQMKYLFWGMALGFLGGATTFPMVFNLNIYPFGAWMVTLYVILSTYAIIRHHLLDIEIVIKKTVFYSILTTLLTGAFLSAVVLSNYLATTIIGKNSIWIGLLAAFATALALNPLRETVQKFVDRTFFKARYDYQNVLRKYSHTLTRPVADLSKFSKIAPYLISKSLNLSGASFMVFNRENKHYKIRAGVKDAKEIIGFTISEDSPLILKMIANKEEISLEEIDYELQSNETLSFMEKEKLEIIKSEMIKLKSDLIIPCISESAYFKKPTLLSTINLGKKLSDEAFSREDIGFLKTLANQSAITIEYAFILEELKREQEKIIKSEKLAALGSITAGIAHELKNPLTYIITITQLLADKPDDKSIIENAIKNLPAEAERMRIIVEGILGYSRSKKLELSELDISDVIKKVLALISYDIKKNNIRLIETYNHTKKIKGDQNRLIEVFMNIIVNAIQAIGEKGGEIVIATYDEGGYIVVDVSDTGSGISSENLTKIFSPFHTTKEAGTGLGLAISKKIIEEHSGSIAVRTAIGCGTTFSIKLPSS